MDPPSRHEPKKQIITARYHCFQLKTACKPGGTHHRIRDEIRKKLLEEIANAQDWRSTVRHASFRGYDEHTVLTDYNIPLELTFRRPVAILNVRYDLRFTGRFYILDPAGTIDAQRDIVVPYLKAISPGTANNFLFDIPTDVAVGTIESLPALISHKDCLLYTFVRDHQTKFFLVPDTWPVTDLLSLYKQQLEGSGKRFELFLVPPSDPGGEWREVQSLKGTTLQSECPNRVFRVIGKPGDYRIVHAILPDGSQQVLYVSHNHPLTKDVLHDQRALISRTQLKANEGFAAKVNESF
jgi:hypothetical protein